MRKVVFTAIIGLVFVTGAVLGTTNLADATIGSAWKALVDRVTALEEQTNGNTIKHVQLLDDEDGNAAGWDPTGTFFTILDPEITTNSVITSNVLPGDPGCEIISVSEGQFSLFCAASSVFDGQTLNYVVMNPP